jgi:hypothetical protein
MIARARFVRFVHGVAHDLAKLLHLESIAKRFSL